jgi:flagellar basal-body rod protein FlgC
MNLFGLMEASGSAMQSERVRAEVVAANMANAETTRTDAGGPYRRQHVIFAANGSPASFADVLGNTTSGSVPQALLSANASAGQVPGGVHIAGIVQDPASPLKRYDPGHPDAGPDGYVSYPDINPLTEMVDLMGATRAYGLNGSAVQAEKGMITAALDIAKS